MKRLPNGTLKKINASSKIPITFISDIVATRRRPGRKNALKLEKACNELGHNVSAPVWMFGTSKEIKDGLLKTSAI